MSEIPYGYCQCGCGQKTEICTHTSKARGHVRGQPLRYIQSHNFLSPKQNIAERFWSKVDIRGKDECWNWKEGTFRNGYGAYRIGKKKYKAHRIAWELANGREPKSNMFIAHAPIVCHNPSCCNPAHLSEKDVTSNNRDKILDGTSRKGLSREK